MMRSKLDAINILFEKISEKFRQYTINVPKIKTTTFFEPERDNLLSCNDGILLHKESFREQL